MRRITWMVAIVMSIVVLLGGCGKKDEAAVVKDLNQVVGKLDSYQATGTMVIHAGQQPLEYQVEVWYQNPHFYRIALTNEDKDITQIVLKNDEGVFVLTPNLNKSFRFQSDWPEKQGQIYLYQSLAQSIIADNNRQFAVENKAYVFDCAANYQNRSLTRQKIWLDKKSYAPQRVEVLDNSANMMVEMNFSQFKFGATFDGDSFDMKRNMKTSSLPALPTTAIPDLDDSQQAVQGGNGSTGSTDATNSTNSANSADSASSADLTNSTNSADSASSADSAGSTDPANAAGSADLTGSTDPVNAAGSADSTGSNPDGAQATDSAAGHVKQEGFGVLEPSYLPSGVGRPEMRDIRLGEEKGVLLRYAGDYHFSIMEARPEAQTVWAEKGKLVDLGYTMGILLGDEQKSLAWTYDGVELRMSSDDLPEEEMIKVAESFNNQLGK